MAEKAKKGIKKGSGGGNNVAELLESVINERFNAFQDSDSDDEGDSSDSGEWSE